MRYHWVIRVEACINKCFSPHFTSPHSLALTKHQLALEHFASFNQASWSTHWHIFGFLQQGCVEFRIFACCYSSFPWLFHFISLLRVLLPKWDLTTTNPYTITLNHFPPLECVFVEFCMYICQAIRCWKVDKKSTKCFKSEKPYFKLGDYLQSIFLQIWLY